MKSITLVAFFCFVNLLAGCEDHVREVDGGFEADGFSEVEEIEVGEDVFEAEEVEEVNADGELEEEIEDGVCLFVQKGPASPESRVVPINAKGVNLLEVRLLGHGPTGVLGLVFEQFGASNANTGSLRIRSETWNISQEAFVDGRLATFTFEQDQLIIMDSSVSLMLETDLNGSMGSGDAFGYRLIEVITTDGGCINGLPIESNLFSVSQACAWILSQDVDLHQIFGSTYECDSDIEVREMNFSIENLTGASIENFRLLNHSEEVVAGPVDLELGNNSFGLNEPFLVSGQSLYLIKIRFDAEPGEVKISLDSVVVYDVDDGTETVVWGDLPFEWNYMSE